MGRFVMGRKKLSTRVFQIGQISGKFLPQPVSMRMEEMTHELFLSIPCPTCRVGSGKKCLHPSGGLRVEPHTHRKLAAIEIVERNGIQCLRDQKTGKQLSLFSCR
jgi:hypothetical protein